MGSFKGEMPDFSKKVAELKKLGSVEDSQDQKRISELRALINSPESRDMPDVLRNTLEGLLETATALAEERALEKIIPPVGEQKADLNKYFERFMDKDDFKVGEFVRVKKGFELTRYPLKGRLAKVVEIVDDKDMMYDDSLTAENPCYHMPLDMLILCLTQEGKPLTFWVTSQFFEKA